MADKISSSERVALVTGSSRGIGKAIAKSLAREKIKVAINYQSNEKLALNVVQEIKEQGGEAKAFQADVSDAQAVGEMIKQIKGAFGGIHILVNNAGITRDNLLLMMKPEEWQKVINTH